MHSKPLSLLATATVFAVALSGCAGAVEDPSTSAPEASVEITYSSQIGTSDTFARQAQWFMDESEKRSNGRITWKTFWNGSLLSAAEIFSGVQDGRVNSGHIANVYEPQKLPLSQITVPFMSSNGEAVARTLTEVYRDNDLLRSEWEEKNGIKVLAWGLTGNSTLAGSTELNDVTDLDGLRLRAAGLTGTALEARGVQPQGIAVGEIFESIERGVIDGYAGLPLQTAVQLKLPEVAANNLDTGMGVFAAVAVVAISMDVWNTIPADLQVILEEVGADLLDGTVDMVSAAEDEACTQLIASGGSVAAISDAEVAAWKAEVFESRILPKYESDAVAAGVPSSDVTAFMDAFAAALAANEASSDYVDGFTRCAHR